MYGLEAFRLSFQAQLPRSFGQSISHRSGFEFGLRVLVPTNSCMCDDIGFLLWRMEYLFVLLLFFNQQLMLEYLVILFLFFNQHLVMV